jgi:hypothetical protein
MTTEDETVIRFGVRGLNPGLGFNLGLNPGLGLRLGTGLCLGLGLGLNRAP